MLFRPLSIYLKLSNAYSVQVQDSSWRLFFKQAKFNSLCKLEKEKKIDFLLTKSVFLFHIVSSAIKEQTGLYIYRNKQKLKMISLKKNS